MSETKTPFNEARRKALEAVVDLDNTKQIAVICAALCQLALSLGLSREQVLAGVSGTYDIISAQTQMQEMVASMTGLTS